VGSRRPLTPIERMIDAATGYSGDGTAPAAQPRWITLRCSKCKREQRAPMLDHDLPGTAVVECACDRCHVAGDRENVAYFDAMGREILEPPTPEPKARTT
jgi:hypothetical protein